MDQDWVAILEVHPDEEIVYGPLSADDAQAFAAFMGKEVDPVKLRRLRSPLREALGWRRAHYASEHGRTNV